MPFSIYLGWITVATVANVTDVLDYLKWDRFGIAPEIWMGIVLAAVLVISALVNFTRRYFESAGDKVNVELSPYDLSKGRIIYRER